ncbi:succinate--CoA ligase subunit alpha, partial [Halostreptopolyspora alba]
MAIMLNSESTIIVQGMTGSEGAKHTARMLAAGSNVVGGVNARKAGQTVTIGDRDLPVFGTVEEAVKETGADTSVVFVPPKATRAAVVEAVDAGIG